MLPAYAGLHSTAKVAKTGDVVFAVSGAEGNPMNQGVDSKEADGSKLMLATMLVGGGAAQFSFFGLCAPDFCTDTRPDRIYTVSAPNCTLPLGEMLRELDDGRNWQNEVTVRETSATTWDVTYDDTVLTFKLRTRARYHRPVGGIQAITLEERISDFKGRTVWGDTYARFPGDAAHDRAVFIDGLFTPPGRGFKYVDISPGTKLRRWWDKMFP